MLLGRLQFRIGYLIGRRLLAASEGSARVRAFLAHSPSLSLVGSYGFGT
jgi:hypothetical protein